MNPCFYFLISGHLKILLFNFVTQYPVSELDGKNKFDMIIRFSLAIVVPHNDKEKILSWYDYFKETGYGKMNYINISYNANIFLTKSIKIRFRKNAEISFILLTYGYKKIK